MCNLSALHLHDENAAIVKLESILWPDGPVCPRCGGQERITPVRGKTARAGLWRCGPCKRQFTVKVGTLFESSHVPVHKWFQAVFLLASSKKGFSAHQLHRVIGVSYKTAWFMAQRIREAMRSGDLAPLGGDGGVVEVDETFIGNDRTVKPKHEKKGRGYHHKHKVLTLVERRTGRARSMVVDSLKAKDIGPIVATNLAREAQLHTDEAAYYKIVGQQFADHQIVRHNSGEYGRGDVHTNTIEGFFSIFKRGMKGVYQHCSKRHLHRYLAEFDFRYSARAALGVDDESRTALVVAGASGKRLLYRDSAAARA